MPCLSIGTDVNPAACRAATATSAKAGIESSKHQKCTRTSQWIYHNLSPEPHAPFSVFHFSFLQLAAQKCIRSLAPMPLQHLNLFRQTSLLSVPSYHFVLPFRCQHFIPESETPIHLFPSRNLSPCGEDRLPGRPRRLAGRPRRRPCLHPARGDRLDWDRGGMGGGVGELGKATARLASLRV